MIRENRESSLRGLSLEQRLAHIQDPAIAEIVRWLLRLEDELTDTAGRCGHR